MPLTCGLKHTVITIISVYISCTASLHEPASSCTDGLHSRSGKLSGQRDFATASAGVTSLRLQDTALTLRRPSILILDDHVFIALISLGCASAL